MKKWQIVISILMLLCLTACFGDGGKEDAQEVPMKKVNGFAESYINELATSPETKGIYFFPEIGQTGMLYYWDLELDDCVVLCGKTECKHSGKSCNGNFEGANPYTLQEYEGKMYVWVCPGANSYVLYEFDRDGSNRREVCRLNVTGGFSGMEDAVLYEDYCYMSVYLNGKAGYLRQGVYRQKLSGDEPAELIWKMAEDSEWEDERVQSLCIQDNKIYFEVFEISPEDSNHKLYCYDIEGGETEALLSTDQGASFVMVENQLLGSFKQGNGREICKMDLETGEVIPFIQDDGSLTYDGTYLYLAGQDGIRVYDLEGKMVDQFECQFDTPEGGNCITTEDYIYFSYDSWKEKEQGRLFQYNVFDKEDIGKEKHTSYYYSRLCRGD